MISRRSFLGVVAAVPFVGSYFAALAAGDKVGRLVPAPREARDFVEDRDTGIRIRFVKQYYITPDPAPQRLDAYLDDDGVMRWYRTTMKG